MQVFRNITNLKQYIQRVENNKIKVKQEQIKFIFIYQFDVKYMDINQFIFCFFYYNLNLIKKYILISFFFEVLNSLNLQLI